jgi:hypothetical protein
MEGGEAPVDLKKMACGEGLTVKGGGDGGGISTKSDE